MITNEFQYQNTRRLLAEFEALAESLQGTADQAPRPKVRAIEIAAAESQADSLRSEIVEYEHLRSGAVTTITASIMLGIAELLIKAGVARGWSQTQLAAALGTAVQQIQRYEATNYASASLARLSDIATALNIEINETAHIRRTAWKCPRSATTEACKRRKYAIRTGEIAGPAWRVSRCGLIQSLVYLRT